MWRKVCFPGGRVGVTVIFSNSLSGVTLVHPRAALTHGTTKGMDRWDIQSPRFQALISFLKSAEGKAREQIEADAIATDVAKFLAFCNPKTLDWSNLWKVSEVRRFLEYLEEQGIGVDGRLTKVERVCTALSHHKLEVIGEDDAVLAGKLGRAQDRLSTIKAALSPKKVQKRHAQMEALSNTPLSLEEISAVVDNADIWAHFDCTTQECKRGG